MLKPLAIYTDYEDFDPTQGVAALREAGFEVVILDTLDPDKLLDYASEVTAILCSSMSLSREILAQLPELKIISRLGQGVDDIAVDYATKRGIWVSNVHDIAAEDVAEHAWALIYALTRELKFFFAATRDNWFDRPPQLPRRLSEMTLGLLGIGHIGSKIGIRAQHHVARTLCFDFTQRPNAVPTGIERIYDLTEMLAQCDIISVQMPLRENTQHIINAKTLAALPQGSFALNVGRGGLVDSHAVRAAIDSGQLAGYAADVFEKEPVEPNNPLFGHPRIITTPHIAYISQTSRKGYMQRQYENIVQWKHTGTPVYPVNSIENVQFISR